MIWLESERRRIDMTILSKIELRGTMISNQRIVPYNPWLSAKYDCHINVECLASFATLKYVDKYVHKGSDRTTFQVTRS